MQKVPIGQIKENPDNPRKIDSDKLNKLIKSVCDFPEMANVRPIVVNKDMMILGGNMRYLAMKRAGWSEIPVEVVDWSEEKQKEFIIKDNVSGGEWDWDLLREEWNVEELDDWGLDMTDLEIIEDKEAEEDNYEIPEEIKTDIVVGDVIEFQKNGETLHRLMCGDATMFDYVEKLMDGQKAEISFTSPPYNTKENAKLSTHQKNGSKYNSYSDDLEDDEYLKLLTDSTNNSILSSEYVFVNIQSLSGNKTALINFLYNMKSVYADTLIWNKQNAQPAMAENVLNSQFEYIHVFSNKANRAIGTKKFRGTLSNVLEISKQTQNKVKEHNATFPINLASHFVLNFCENSVLDLFIGSGTTMVACHQLDRRCYGMELDPKYCQVVVDRMQKLDNTLVVLRNGEKLDNVS